MASSSQIHLLFLFPFFLISLTFSQRPFQPDALVVSVSKHASTLQYVTRINQRTPLVPIDVVLDLGGQFLWVSCDSSYISSSCISARCHSTQCSLAHANTVCNHCLSRSVPQCNNDTCILFSKNVFTSQVSVGELSEDVLSLHSTNGLYPSHMVSVPRFLFSCASEFLLEGLASGAKGIAGLGQSRIGLPTQLSAAFNFSRKFAVCLPPSIHSNGVIFFGDGPYVLLPNIDISKLLIYTPLVKRTRSMATSSTSGLSDEYFIRVKSIRVNGEQLALNSSLLSIDDRGTGGTKISTVNPYTVLETSIYSSLTKFFIRETMVANVTRVAPVAPFDVCFNTESTNATVTWPGMPIIDLMLQNEEVFWRIFETNSMVSVADDIACLGFLDGGLNPRTSIVIGGYQLEDNLLQFDLVSSQLGFTSSLLLRQTSCANFNFSSNI